MATLEGETTPKAATNQHRHTEKLNGDTYQKEYLPPGREEGECESATICKKAQLIHYDQEAKQQSTTTLATNP